MKQYYHYTSIETFAKILESKTWKFSRLDKVDDRQEWEHLPFQLAKQIYISCYTLDDTESIPIWDKYGDNSKGIRINFQNHLHVSVNELFSVSGNGTYNFPKVQMADLLRLRENVGDFKFHPHYEENQKLFREVEFLQVEYALLDEISERKSFCVKELDGKLG